MHIKQGRINEVESFSSEVGEHVVEHVGEDVDKDVGESLTPRGIFFFSSFFPERCELAGKVRVWLEYRISTDIF